MEKKYIQISLLLSLLLFFSVIKAQDRRVENLITVENTVADEYGSPVEGAIVYGNEGTVFVKTDSSGKFIISIIDQSDIYIEADGFESTVYKALDYKVKDILILTHIAE